MPSMVIALITPTQLLYCHIIAAVLLCVQVIRLCESAGLYSALTFIYNHIGDYRKPLLDLLAAVAGAASFPEAQWYCCKLLVYLRCCFRGLKFPPGTGHLSRYSQASCAHHQYLDESLSALTTVQPLQLWCSRHVASPLALCYAALLAFVLASNLRYSIQSKEPPRCAM